MLVLIHISSQRDEWYHLQDVDLVAIVPKTACSLKNYAGFQIILFCWNQSSKTDC